MKLKLGEVAKMHQAVARLAKERLPVKLSFAVAKWATAIREEFRAYEVQREKLVRQYGKVGDGGSVTVTPDLPGYQEFVDKFVELGEIEVEVGNEKISLPEDLSITPEDILALGPILAE